MTVKEAASLIGHSALYTPGGGLSHYVRIVDVKMAWGRTRYLITPEEGHGEQWVETGLRLVDDQDGELLPLGEHGI